MTADLTQEEFSKHLNTKFGVQLGDGPRLELELVEVKSYIPREVEESGMERFSAYFKGPGDHQLPQNTYSFQHDSMGTFEIFIVPIARDEQGVRYEAVYNYFK